MTKKEFYKAMQKERGFKKLSKEDCYEFFKVATDDMVTFMLKGKKIGIGRGIEIASLGVTKQTKFLKWWADRMLSNERPTINEVVSWIAANSQPAMATNNTIIKGMNDE